MSYLNPINIIAGLFNFTYECVTCEAAREQYGAAFGASRAAKANLDACESQQEGFALPAVRAVVEVCWGLLTG